LDPLIKSKDDVFRYLIINEGLFFQFSFRLGARSDVYIFVHKRRATTFEM